MAQQPQSDPWAEAAKDYKPSAVEPSATQKPNEDWKLWQQGGDNPGDARNPIQMSFNENTKTSPSEPLFETGLKSVVGAIGTPFVHPIETAKGMARAIVPDEGGKGMAEAAFGPAGPILTHMFGGVASQGKQDKQEGGLPYAATKMAGNIAGNIALGGGADAIGEGVAALPTRAKAGAVFKIS